MVLCDKDLLFRFRLILHTFNGKNLKNQTEAEQKNPVAKYYHYTRSLSVSCSLVPVPMLHYWVNNQQGGHGTGKKLKALGNQRENTAKFCLYHSVATPVEK